MDLNASQLLVFGFIRETESHSYQYHIIPLTIYQLIMIFYPVFSIKWSQIYKGPRMTVDTQDTSSSSKVSVEGGKYDVESIRMSNGVHPGMIVRFKIECFLIYWTRNFFGVTDDWIIDHFSKGADDTGGPLNCWGIGNYTGYNYQGSDNRLRGYHIRNESLSLNEKCTLFMEVDYKTRLKSHKQAILSFWINGNLATNGKLKSSAKEKCTMVLPNILEADINTHATNATNDNVSDYKKDDEFLSESVYNDYPCVSVNRRMSENDWIEKRKNNEFGAWFPALSLCHSGAWVRLEIADSQQNK